MAGHLDEPIRAIEFDLKSMTFGTRIGAAGLPYAEIEIGEGETLTVPVEVPEGGATGLVVDVSMDDSAW